MIAVTSPVPSAPKAPAAAQQPAPGPQSAAAAKPFANLDALSEAFGDGAVKAGDQISVSGRIWNTADGASLGRVRLTSDSTYLTTRLTGSQGILDALEAVSKDRTGTPVTLTGTLRGLSWDAAPDDGIEVASVLIPALDA